MTFYLMTAVPMGLVWAAIANTAPVESFILGFLISLLVLAMLRPPFAPVRWGRLPGQIVNLILYTLLMFRDIFLSSIDVARRVLSPTMPLRPGIVAVPTQDADEREMIAALSAHNITITPGELVVDFEGNHTMYVHCLDVEATSQTAATAQSRRLRLLKKIL